MECRIVLQTRIDIRCNIANIILQNLVALFQLALHLPDGIEDGGMIPGELLTDVGQAQVVSFRIRYMAVCRASAVPLFFSVPLKTASSTL